MGQAGFGSANSCTSVSEHEKWLNILVSSVMGRHIQELDLKYVYTDDVITSAVNPCRFLLSVRLWVLIDRHAIGNQCHTLSFHRIVVFLTATHGQKGENKIYIWQGRKGVWGLHYVFIAVVGEDSCTCAVTQSHCLAKVNYMEALAHNSLAILAKLYFNTYII